MSTDNPLVSIIVPVYNVELFIDECISSLVNQTLSNIEIILVNDASTDKSLEKIVEWSRKDDRIVVINSKQNLRQGGARNLGIKAARADYIGFVDSDDFVSYEMYENLYNNIHSSNGLTNDIVISNTYFVYDNGCSIPQQNFDVILKSTAELKKYIVLNGCRMVTNIVRKAVLLNNDLLYPERVIYEDNAVSIPTFLAANGIKVVSGGYYYYRKNIASTTQGKNNYSFFDRLETARIMLEHTKRLGYYVGDYHDAIDYAFYKLFYRNTISYISLSECFDKVPYEKIKEVVSSYKNINPKIYSNIYYKKYFSIIDFLVVIVSNFPFIIPFVQKTNKLTKIIKYGKKYLHNTSKGRK